MREVLCWSGNRKKSKVSYRKQKNIKKKKKKKRKKKKEGNIKESEKRLGKYLFLVRRSKCSDHM